MKMEFDITKMVEEIAMQAKENQEEFIIETIQPYCEDILQIKINKEELKQILLNGIQKQQPCEDVISRKDVLSLFNKSDEYRWETTWIRRKIEELPSVTPTISDVENNFNIGYNCGYADAMCDIAESEDKE